MYAPAGTPFRQTTRDTDILGHFVPAKTQVAINVHAWVRLADWWPDPDTFDPARFIDRPERRTAVSRYAFAPFGGGAHKCIGQQFADMTVKTTMHRMLRRFRWCVADGYRIPLTWGTGPTPADDLPITLRAHAMREALIGEADQGLCQSHESGWMQVKRCWGRW